MSVAPARETICAIIVTFHPDRDLPERLERIASQVQRVIVVDNHSDESTIVLLRGLSSRLGIQLILNQENRGVATALNQGMAECIGQGFAWALLFDQDTTPYDSMVTTFTRVYEDFPNKRRLAVIGSNYVDPASQKTALRMRGDDRALWVERKTAITSGSLLSVSAFEIIGPFRDELFIDEVDNEYCLRARAFGFKVVAVRQPLMTHAIGAAAPKRFLWKTVQTSNHSSVRWYYMARNPIVMAQEYWFRESFWVLGNLYARLKWMIKVILYETDRGSKIKLMLRGAWHGLTGKLGRLEG